MADIFRSLCVLLVVLSVSHSMDFSEQLGALADTISLKYFRIFRCVTYIVEDDNASGHRWSSDHPILLISTKSSSFNELVQNGIDSGCSGFVVQVSRENRASVIGDLVFAYKKALGGRYNNKRYLILPENERDKDTTFLSSKDMFYMPNLLFVTSFGNSTFRVFSHNYFNGHKYDVLNITHEVVDIWCPDKGFASNVDLYPDKIANLNGKEVKISMMHYSPYSVVIDDGKKVIYDGLETRITRQFVEASNGTFVAEDNPVYLWGDIFPNQTGTGIFGAVFEHRADMGFGAIYQWYCDIMECSYPHLRAEVTCLVPKPDIVSGWMTIILPFEPITWVGFIVAYLIASLSAFVVTILWNRLKAAKAHGRKVATLFDSLFNLYRIQLNQTSSVAAKSTPIGYFLKLWVLYCFTVSLCWQCEISSFLTVPRYEKPITDATELVSRFPHVHWGANHNVWIKSIEKSSEPLMVKIVKEFVIMNDAKLRARIPRKDFAYFIERLPSGHFGYSKFIEYEGMKYLKIMEKNIYFGFCVVILSRGSPYQERLNHVLLKMTDMGIIPKMEVQVSLEYADNKLQTIIRHSAEKQSDKAKKLRVSHILGAVIIYVSGVLTSSVAFLVEVAALKHKTTFFSKTTAMLRTAWGLH